jgi:peroxiredoxin family protein
MSPLMSWLALAGVVLVIFLIFWGLSAWLDEVQLKHVKNADIDAIFRQDKAREVMRKWAPENDPETIRMLNRALEKPGEVVVFTRDENGELHEDE